MQHYDEDAVGLSSSSSPSPLTPRTQFDLRRKAIARLTLTLIMQLTIEQIRAIRAEFDGYEGGVDLCQFVYVMTKHVYSPQLSFKPSPSLFIQSLIELFEAMDLDGDHSLEWEELLSTIVHMGMGATDHLVLSPINAYRQGPEYYGSKGPSDKSVRWHDALGRLLYVETEGLVLRIEEAAMKGDGVEVRVGQSSVLCCEYIHGYGNTDEMKIGGDDRTPAPPPPPPPKPAPASSATKPTSPSPSRSSPSSRSQRASEPSPASRKEQQARRKSDRFAFYKRALLLTAHDKRHSAKTFHASHLHSPPPTLKPLTAPESRTGAYITDAHSDETYYTVKERSPSARLGHDDLLATSTSQYLSLWEGLPGADVVLCDTKKLKCPYSALRWCPATQRLFAGDISGAVHSWRVVNAVGGSHAHQKWTPSTTVRQPTVPKLVKERSFLGHRDVITALVTIPSMSFLLTASLDHDIRMWAVHSGALKNVFRGHRAGVVDLCYSNEYRFLLSASIDHDVAVWSPFAEHVVFKLVGHTAPLVGVQFVSGTPQIVTADVDGWMKVWDARNFTCCQTFLTTPNMTAFTTCGDRHSRIFVVSRQPVIHTYDCEGGPYLKATEDDPVYAALYSTLSLAFLTCNRKDIKLWNALSGRLSRVYRGLSDAPISALCFDRRERKLFVGDKAGKIRVYNALTGAYMKSLSPHADEVSYLEYFGEQRELVSASVDLQVKVHDERPIEEQVVLLDLSLGRDVELLGVAVSQARHMVAVASSDGRVGLWSVENSLKDEVRRAGAEVMSAVAFLDPHPLLVVGDEGGVLTAYFTRPSVIKGEVAFSLVIGRDTDDLVGGVTVLRWDNDDGRQVLWVGNIHGQVLSYALHGLIAQAISDMEAHAKDQYTRRLDGGPSQMSSPKLSPLTLHSPLPTTRPGRRNARRQSLSLAQCPYVSPAILRQVAELQPSACFQAHPNAVSSITVVREPRAVVTTARMHHVKVWSDAGELLGLMDSQEVIGRGRQGGSGEAAGAEGAEGEKREWKFVVDVGMKERGERDATEKVLVELEGAQRREEERRRSEKEAEERESEAERAARKVAKRASVVQNDRWLPLQWQQVVREAGESAPPDHDGEQLLVDFMNASRTKPKQTHDQQEDGDDHGDVVQEELGQRQPGLAASARSRSTSLPVPTVRFGKALGSARGDSECAPGSDGKRTVREAAEPTTSSRALEEEKETLAAPASSRSRSAAEVALPPLNFSATQPLPLPRQAVAASKRSARPQPSQRPAVAEHKEQTVVEGAAQPSADGREPLSKAFAYPAVHQTATSSSSSFSLGLDGHHSTVHLTSAQRSAAKRLQHALDEADSAHTV